MKTDTVQSNAGAKRNFSWTTTKTADGFSFRVFEIISSNTPNAEGHYATYVTMKQGACPTRPQATGAAKRWTKYLRAGGAL